MFLLFGQGRVLYFAVWAGARAPPKQQKQQKNDPAQTAKKNTPRPFRACCCFCCLGGWACYLFCCLGVESVLFVAVWAGGVCFFLLFGPGACFFCCLGGGRVFSLLFGRGTGVHSLTVLPGLSSSDPTTKKTKQQNKNTGSTIPINKTDFEKLQPINP